MTCNFCIIRGDDAPNFVFIDLDENQTALNISKIVTTCSGITHTFENPQFPIIDGYSADETIKFDWLNTIYVGAVLSNGDFYTFRGQKLEFRTCPKVVEYTKGE